REVNPAVLANARVLGADRTALLRHVYFPAAASWILSSLRTSVGFAVVGAIIGEYLGASAGLGYLIAQAEGNFNSIAVFAGIVILAVFVLIVDRLLDLLESSVITWRPSSASRTMSSSTGTSRGIAPRCDLVRHAWPTWEAA